MKSTFCKARPPRSPGQVARLAFLHGPPGRNGHHRWTLYAVMAVFAVSQGCYAEEGVPFVVKTTPSQMAGGTIIQGRQVPTWRPNSAPPAAVYPDNRYTPPSTRGTPSPGQDPPPADTVVVVNLPAEPSASPTTGLLSSQTSGFSASARDTAVAASPAAGQRNAAQAGTYADSSVATATVGPAPQPQRRSTEGRSLPPPTAAAQSTTAAAIVAASSSSGAPPTSAEFSIAGGQRLSAALHEFLNANHMRMQWNTRADFLIQHPYHLTGSTFQDTLRQVLAAYGLSATIWQANSVVEVYTRNGEAQ